MSMISVIIPTIPPRTRLLRQALWSVLGQTLKPQAIIVEYDHDHTGAAATKNRALAKVRTQFFCCLDDDDQFMPHHLEMLWDTFIQQQHEQYDVIYSWPEMIGAGDPRPDRFGKPFDADVLRRASYIPTTALVNTQLAKAAGGFQKPEGSNYDDWGLWLAMLDGGAKFYHLAQRTWLWRVMGQNTSGRGDRWG